VKEMLNGVMVASYILGLVLMVIAQPQGGHDGRRWTRYQAATGVGRVRPVPVRASLRADAGNGRK